MLLTRHVDEGGGRIKIAEIFLPVRIRKEAGARLVIHGTLTIVPHMMCREETTIDIRTNAILEIKNDMQIGNGCRFLVDENAKLVFGGVEKESASGITANTVILCKKRIVIGSDFLCAWGVTITDSDWHNIHGQESQSDIEIGNHVWLAHSVSILKGAVIGSNSIVGCHSVVTKGVFPSGSLLAGCPAEIKKENVQWSR